MIRAILLLISIIAAPMSWGDLGLDAWVDHQFGPISAWISGGCVFTCERVGDQFSLDCCVVGVGWRDVLNIIIRHSSVRIA